MQVVLLVQGMRQPEVAAADDGQVPVKWWV
jgi:hypothetical protein